MLEQIEKMPEPCTAPGHKPHMYISLRPGVYRWTCDRCNIKKVFRVN